jgi:hypothetical protein
MLDLAVIDYEGRACLYIDKFSRKKLDVLLKRNRSNTYRWIAKLQEAGIELLEYGGNSTYYVNESIYKYLKGFAYKNSLFIDRVIDMDNLQSSVFLDEEIDRVGLTDREKKLFNTIKKYMVKYKNNNLYNEICSIIEFKLPPHQKPSDSLKNKRKIYKEEVNNEHECYESKYFVFITPKIREAIRTDMNYCMKYFHADLSGLCQKGVLIRMHPYRYFLNPNYTVHPLDQNKLGEEEKSQPCGKTEPPLQEAEKPKVESDAFDMSAIIDDFNCDFILNDTTRAVSEPVGRQGFANEEMSQLYGKSEPPLQDAATHSENLELSDTWLDLDDMDI